MRAYDKEIIRGYNCLKRQAIKDCHKDRIDESIAKVKQLHLVGNRLTWIYDDTDLSNLVDQLSFKMLGQQVKDNRVENNNVVFYDQYGKSYVLALQYLEALSEAGFQILYILSDFVDTKPSDFIIDELRRYSNIRIAIIPSEWTYKKRAEEILRLTVDFAPAKVFMHVKFFSVFNLVLPVLPKQYVKYYIDLQDHAMWIKNNQIDYVIPYRTFGATIDFEKRGFNDDQILLVPYYPIIRDIPFKGFPDGLEGKVIIFTGGEFYKTISDKNYYWRLVFKILEENQNAVILYAIKGELDNDLRKRFVVIPESISARLIPIGFRDDINEVFKHCDIYMGTSPMSGGLMSQYAALNSKPILQFYPQDLSSNNETEQVLNFNGSGMISFSDERLFLNEAKSLINDNSYRKLKGDMINSFLITKKQFNELLIKTIQENKSQCRIEYQTIDYEALTSWWFSLEREGIGNCREYLLSVLKKRKYTVMPFSSLHSILHNSYLMNYLRK